MTEVLTPMVHWKMIFFLIKNVSGKYMNYNKKYQDLEKGDKLGTY